jgi:hypothetical protein
LANRAPSTDSLRFGRSIRDFRHQAQAERIDTTVCYDRGATARGAQDSRGRVVATMASWLNESALPYRYAAGITGGENTDTSVLCDRRSCGTGMNWRTDAGSRIACCGIFTNPAPDTARKLFVKNWVRSQGVG